MRDPVVIIGAGASAVHAAQTALEAGRKVIMLDVGGVGAPPVMPGASLNQLKSDLKDPVAYFLGEDFSSLVLPTDGDEYYGLPPSKDYVFGGGLDRNVETKGFAPLWSGAAGGLGQAWTGGCYPFSDGELKAFPFGWNEIEPAYSEVARRIGVSGSTSDDLSPYMPVHDAIQTPVAMDAHSEQLLGLYQSKRAKLQAKHNMVLGRARLATLSADHNARPACSRCGRCLWGCPTESIYTPSITLALCRRHAGFTYIGNVRVSRFLFDDGNTVTHVVAANTRTGEELKIEVGSLVLAAGALGSARILLESLHHAGIRAELDGLMDNRQVLMPFVNVRRIGAGFDDRSYQYNQLAAGAPGETPFDYVHGLITTLTTALIHPVAQTLPSGMRMATSAFRNLHGALGLANINFPDTRRTENRITLEAGADGQTKLLIQYTPDAREPERLKAAISRFRGFLGAMGCIAPPSMTRPRPMGASVHYAGLMPMTIDGGDYTTDALGRCRPFENLIVADGSTFSALPAKNLTFTLMANATRIMRGNLGV
jgi:choline dehydrogenase-like flavoprotein